MNILPKKSWHVRNKDNVEKVRRDEENARLEEKEQQRRAAIAEQEARTSYLREKARSRALENSDDLKKLLKLDGEDAAKALVPANLFSDSSLERGATSLQKNAENEKEKKEEQIKYEKKIGLLVGLGQSAAETMDDTDKPWYFRKPERISDKRGHSSGDERNDEKDSKRKMSLDPIQAMKGHLQKKKLSEENRKIHGKQHKHKRKHKHRSPEREVIPRKKSSSDKLAKLREERLKREKKERERTMLLLNGDKNDNPVEKIPGKYNSQFNPHLVRQKTYHRHY